ncbi:Ankyrin repeat [Sesbania bispinosa]|nr:Ankyrin repeat [Sesbania bispinosa]
MAGINVLAYGHSSVHKAIIMKDYDGLKEILADLPKLCNPYEIKTESASIAEEEKAAAISAVVNRRDVPNGDTPLHLAAKLGDLKATEMLMVAGANDSLKNKEEGCLVIYLQNLEKGWEYESRYDLAGFDGLKIKRSDQSVLFLGDVDRLDNGKKVPGSLCMMSHKNKEVVVSTLASEPPKPTEREVRQSLAKKYKSKVVRVGIDVSEALLVPQLTWRRKERKEMVGPWKTKVYDMQNVVLSVKSKRVPGAPAEAKITPKQSEKEGEKIEDILTEEERKQLEVAVNSTEENGHTNHVRKKKKDGLVDTERREKTANASSGNSASRQ